jgi:hypothetical protein
MSNTPKKTLKPIGDPRNNHYGDRALSCCGMIMCTCVEFSVEIGDDEPERVAYPVGTRSWAFQMLQAGLVVVSDMCDMKYSLRGGRLQQSRQSEDLWSLWRVRPLRMEDLADDVRWSVFIEAESKPERQEAKDRVSSQEQHPCAPGPVSTSGTATITR